MARAFADRERGWSAAELRALATQPGVAVPAEDSGFGVVRSVAGEAEILTLAVAPRARGRGLGRALVQAMLDAAHEDGATRVLLEVAESNAAARALYAGAGFTEIGRRPAYFRRSDGTREDALLMAVEIGEVQADAG